MNFIASYFKNSEWTTESEFDVTVGALVMPIKDMHMDLQLNSTFR